MCVTGMAGQRELKSEALEIQLFRQKGHFCLELQQTGNYTKETEGFPLSFDLGNLI